MQLSAVGLGALAMVGLFLLLGGSSDESISRAPAQPESRPAVAPAKLRDPADLPRPTIATTTCRVDTPEPGFFVFVDGEPVRDEAGEWLKTPCEVTVPRGDVTIAVAREGWLDASRVVNLSKIGEIEFTPVASSNAAGGILHSPYLNAPVGTAIPLSEINQAGRWFDPFLSADGLSLWFAGAGPEGNGVYTATRRSRFDRFDSPQLLLLSRGTEIPASPSVTSDGLLVAYASKNRVWGLVRANPLASFDDKRPLKFSPRATADWQSAQISADGRQLYWQERLKDVLTGWRAERKKLDEEFGRAEKFELPDGHPRFSRDGLRHYTLEGGRLLRHRRLTLDDPFAAPETIAELSLPEFEPQAERRQFAVSEDEQWLVFAGASTAVPQLYLVRLADRPQWGFVPQGKAVAPKPPPMLADRSKMSDEPEPDAEEMVDPRSQPLAYVAFQQRFAGLMAERKWDEAETLLASHRKSAELAEARELLDWDAADLERVRTFWKDLEAAVAMKKPGDTVRISGASLEFQKFADGQLTARAKTKEITKPLVEISGSELVLLADAGIDRQDAEAQLRIATFLHYDSRGQSSLVKARLERAGALGLEFTERLARRRLHAIEQEMKRENVLVALQLIDKLEKDAPETSAAKQAAEYRKQVYTLFRWNPVGPRDWTITPEGDYIASAEQQRGSYLLSPRQYGNFELTLEWKTTGPVGQGGVYFRYSGEDRPNSNAFKIQLTNDYGVTPDNFCTGSLFGVAPPTKNAVRRGGEWNTLRLRVEGERVQAEINGEPVLDTIARDNDIPLAGLLALDGEIGGITYRKILIVELPGGPAAGTKDN